MKLKFNVKAFEEIRRSPGVRRDLRSRVDRIAAQAGEGYAANVTEGRTRSRGSVVTATGKAVRDSAKNNSLVRSLEAGR